TLCPPSQGSSHDEAARRRADPETMARRDFARWDPSQDARRRWAWVSRLSDSSLWLTFETFKRLVGGKPPDIPSEPPVDLGDAAGQAGFLELDLAFGQADIRADRLSNAHRSQQLIL